MGINLHNRKIKNSVFSPFFVLGKLIKPLPKLPIELLMQHVATTLEINHPNVMRRLESLSGKEFLICPLDFPYKIMLRLNHKSLKIKLVDYTCQVADVTIIGSFDVLLQMLDGKTDGDGLFFDRSIMVKGDTSALLTLRNAMDSDDINLKDEIIRSFGIFKKPITEFINLTDLIYYKLDHELNDLNRALMEPLMLRVKSVEAENSELKEKLSMIEKSLSKSNKKLYSMSRRLK